MKQRSENDMAGQYKKESEGLEKVDCLYERVRNR